MAIVEDDTARHLLDAVAGCEGVQDPRHPVRASMLDVERTALCPCEQNAGSR